MSAVLLMHLERAERHVAGARQSWSEHVGASYRACLEHLQQAIAELQQAQAAAARGAASPEAKTRLERLRQDLKRLGRLMDAAGAFYRVLALPGGVEETVTTVAEA
jgi:hypothetical protein